MGKKLIIGLVLVLVLVGAYFAFFHMSESRARNILKESFFEDRGKVCDRFFVSEWECDDFHRCYVSSALLNMEGAFMKRFARDVRDGKSVAFDSYGLVNGKVIGEECLKEILDMPDDLNLNVVGNEPLEELRELELMSDSETCKDSDGGKDYFSAGVVSTNVPSAKPGEFVKGTDSCSKTDSKNLVEYYCDEGGNLRVDLYECPKSCIEGACI